MSPLDRREFLALAAVPPLLQALPTGSMFVCMHEASSDRFDFKTAMEGYAKAGIRAVEPTLPKVREFAEKESPATARRLLDDLGLKAVSSSNPRRRCSPVSSPKPGSTAFRASGNTTRWPRPTRLTSKGTPRASSASRTGRS